MASRLRTAFIEGSGTLLDTVVSTTITTGYIKQVIAMGGGLFDLTAVSTDPFGSTFGTKLKFDGTGGVQFEIPDRGAQIFGVLSVSAPASTSTIMVLYY